jgi:hypothetical protein
MTKQELREQLHEQPFRAFHLRTNSGQRHFVPHPDFLLIPAIHPTVIVVTENGVRLVDVAHVEAVELDEQASPAPNAS